MEHHVAQHVDAVLNIVGEDAAVVASALLIGESVKRAAPTFYRFSDVPRGSAFSSFEQHVLNEMGNPCLAIGFVPTTGFAPQADCRRLNIINRPNEHAYATVTSEFF